MKIFRVTLFYQFLDYLEKDCLALKTFGDIKEIMTYTLKWCSKMHQSQDMDKAKQDKIFNLAILKFLRPKESHLLKWDMLEHYLHIADGKKVVSKVSMIAKVFYLLTLEIHYPIKIIQSIKKALYKLKKTS